ncbi:hypothetical protein OAU50_06925 [Planctomycetota bacterium]|nr:hypothetical protein [Planctomycetota bacterium]
MTPQHAYSLFEIGLLSSEEIHYFAHLWLGQGIYTDSLMEIISEPTPQMSTLGPLFKSAMKELGFVKPSLKEAARCVCQVTLEKMVTNEIGLEEGASYLYWKISTGLATELPDVKYVGDAVGLARVFTWLREIWDLRDGSMILYYTDLPPEEAQTKFIEHIHEEAKVWLQQNQIT